MQSSFLKSKMMIAFKNTLRLSPLRLLSLSFASVTGKRGIFDHRQHKAMAMSCEPSKNDGC